MKKAIVRVIIVAMILCVLSGLLAGCILKDNVVDGPGMVNYQGLMLDALVGDWFCIDDGNYLITFYDDYTLNMSYGDVPLLEKASLALYPANANMDEYSEFDLTPNVFTDQAGNSFEITKASHENGTVTMELTLSDGTKSTLMFSPLPELLDGAGMIYYGGFLDDALTGRWSSADERFILDFDGKYADFFVDGEQLVSKDYGYFVEHSFSENNDLNERCDLYPTGNYLDDFDEPPLAITEMWYQAEHIYMNITWQNGEAAKIVFDRVPDSE